MPCIAKFVITVTNTILHDAIADIIMELLLVQTGYRDYM